MAKCIGYAACEVKYPTTAPKFDNEKTKNFYLLHSQYIYYKTYINTESAKRPCDDMKEAVTSSSQITFKQKILSVEI